MSDEELNSYRASAEFREVNEPEYPKLGPCQMHSVFNDAEDWREYEARRAVDRISIETIKAEMIDEATELRKQANRLMRLVGRL